MTMSLKATHTAAARVTIVFALEIKYMLHNNDNIRQITYFFFFMTALRGNVNHYCLKCMHIILVFIT